MPFVAAVPDVLSSATADLARIGSTLDAAHAFAAVPTTGILSAAQDEVSTAIAALFSGHALGYQALALQAAAFHERFVQNLSGGAVAYAGAEAANATVLQDAVDNAINSLSALGSEVYNAPGTQQILTALAPVTAIIDDHAVEIATQAIIVGAHMSPIADVGFAVVDGAAAVTAATSGRPWGALAYGVSFVGDIVGIVNPPAGTVINALGVIANDTGSWTGVAGF